MNDCEVPQSEGNAEGLKTLVLPWSSSVVAEKFRRVPLIAHRGYRRNGEPGNTVISLELAEQRGYGGEVDIQLTADNVPVLLHDGWIARRRGTLRSVRELRYRDLKRSAGVLGKREVVPSLQTALESVELPLLLDIKDRKALPTVAEVVHSISGAANRVMIITYCPRCTRKVRRVFGLAACLSVPNSGVLRRLEQGLSNDGADEHAPADSLAISRSCLSWEQLSGLTRNSLVICWRVQSEESWRECRRNGVTPVSDYFPH